MDYNKMYCGDTDLDKLVRDMTAQGWKMFAHEHPENNTTIDVVLAAGEQINDVKFQQKFLYKDGNALGSCAIARFWR